MRRGEVWDADLDPVQGSEQAGIRPVVIVTHDSINASSGTVLGVPCSTYRPGRRVYASQVLLRAPAGELTADSVALGEQTRVLAKQRFKRRRGALSAADMNRLEQAILRALDIR